MKRIIPILLLIVIFFSFSLRIEATKGDELIFLPRGDYYQAVHKALEEAKESIYVVMYVLKKGPGERHPVNLLMNDLINAKKKGLRVRVILDESVKDFEGSALNNEAYQRLLQGGVDVRFDAPYKITHVKLIVIDEYITILGSHNWSLTAFQLNNESSILIKSKRLARDFITYFNGRETLAPTVKVAPPKVKVSPPKAVAIAAPPIHLQTGKNYYENRLYDKAILELERTIKINPNLVEAHYYLALSYEGKGEKTKAMAKLEEIMKKDRYGEWGQKAGEAYRRLK